MGVDKNQLGMNISAVIHHCHIIVALFYSLSMENPTVELMKLLEQMLVYIGENLDKIKNDYRSYQKVLKQLDGFLPLLMLSHHSIHFSLDPLFSSLTAFVKTNVSTKIFHEFIHKK